MIFLFKFYNHEGYSSVLNDILNIRNVNKAVFHDYMLNRTRSSRNKRTCSLSEWERQEEGSTEITLRL